MLFSYLKRLSLLMMLLLFLGCSSSPKTKASFADSNISSWIPQAATIEIQQAYAGDYQLLMKLQAFSNDSMQGQTFYARAIWDSADSAQMGLVGNSSVPLEFITQEQWAMKREGLSSVESLSENHWQKFRSQLMHRLTPQKINTGAQVVSGGKEFVFYYDNDHLTVVSLEDKPSDIQVVDVYNQEKISMIMANSFRNYLRLLNQREERVILSTIHQGDHLTPFLYIDLDKQVAMSLSIEDPSQKKYEEQFLKKGLKTFDHLIIDSHLLGMLTRPFSSMLRLVSWSKDTAYDVVNPTKLAMMENKPFSEYYDGPGMDLEAWETKLDKIIGEEASAGKMEFLVGGDQFFPRLVEKFNAAEKSIYVRIFIFDNDDYAVTIADILKAKSREGVEVKVLLDGMGQIMGEGKIPESLPAGFIPPDSIVKYLQEDSSVQVRVRPNAWFKADHIKTIIVDDKVCYTGGMNIGREYRYDWHDLMMEVKGSIISKILAEFDSAWAHASRLGDIGLLANAILSHHVPGEGEGYPIRLLYTRLNDPQIYRAQVAAIREAKKYIYIHNAYFSDNVILYELIKARRRGVDVRVILPVNGNHEIMNASNIVTANNMFKNGIRVYFYPGMSHIKAAIYDGWLCAGSANFDRLSLRDNLELNLATSHSKTVSQFQEILFEEDFVNAKEMTKLLESGIKERLAEILADQL